MRRRRNVFLDSFIALGISWGTASYYRQAAGEVFFPLITILGLICLAVLLPVALRHLPPGGPCKRGLFLAAGLSPLLILFSHPNHVLSTFQPLWLGLELEYYPLWALKYFLHSFLFFLTGYIFSEEVPTERITWGKCLLVLIILIIIYTGTFYAGLVFYQQYPAL